MANLTIKVDEEVLRKARIRALEQGTSVNAILSEYLRAYASIRATNSAATRVLLEMSRNAKSASGGRKWTRDELHER
jgi:plasmid stability protein